MLLDKPAMPRSDESGPRHERKDHGRNALSSSPAPHRGRRAGPDGGGKTPAQHAARYRRTTQGRDAARRGRGHGDQGGRGSVGGGTIGQRQFSAALELAPLLAPAAGPS